MAAPSFTVGPIRCEVILDGTGLYRKETLFTDVPEAELARAVDGLLNDEGLLPVPGLATREEKREARPVLDRTSLPDYRAASGPAVSSVCGPPHPSAGRKVGPLHACRVTATPPSTVLVGWFCVPVR
jgi:hypothetical protein